MIMRLNPGMFELVKNRTKTIEARMYDEKRKILKEGDIITFLLRPECIEEAKVRVTKLEIYHSFDFVYDNCNVEKMGHFGVTKGEFSTIMSAFYPGQRGKIIVIYFEILED